MHHRLRDRPVGFLEVASRRREALLGRQAIVTDMAAPRKAASLRNDGRGHVPTLRERRGSHQTPRCYRRAREPLGSGHNA